MLTIQNGGNWWIDGVARFSGGNIGRSIRAGAMNATAMNDTAMNATAKPTPAAWGSDPSGSITTVTSDLEEQGQLALPGQQPQPGLSGPDTLSPELQIRLTRMSGVSNVVAAAATRIGVIQAIMRDHQSGGTGNFDRQKTDDSDKTGDDSSSETLTGDMLQNPSLAFSAASPSTDRPGIYSLLL